MKCRHAVEAGNTPAHLSNHLGSPPQRQNHFHINPINLSRLCKMYKNKQCHALESILTVMCRDLTKPMRSAKLKTLCLNNVSLFSTSTDTSQEIPRLRKPHSISSSHKHRNGTQPHRNPFVGIYANVTCPTICSNTPMLNSTTTSGPPSAPKPLAYQPHKS